VYVLSPSKAETTTLSWISFGTTFFFQILVTIQGISRKNHNLVFQQRDEETILPFGQSTHSRYHSALARKRRAETEGKKHQSKRTF
jgi:hypothetical protein